jgi:acetyl-CoA carboxylase carboxyltransferase component
MLRPVLYQITETVSNLFWPEIFIRPAFQVEFFFILKQPPFTPPAPMRKRCLMAFHDLLDELHTRRHRALAMGGPAKIAKRRSEGVLNARERLDYVLDAGSFVAFGLMATSVHQDVRHKTPADGKLAGVGRINGRPVAIVSNDFTTLGAVYRYCR